MDPVEWYKMRVARAAEMVRRALERHNQALVNHWLAEFKSEVQRLNTAKEDGNG